eukprot:4584577-Prymnesium_polylepis.1
MAECCVRCGPRLLCRQAAVHPGSRRESQGKVLVHVACSFIFEAQNGRGIAGATVDREPPGGGVAVRHRHGAPGDQSRSHLRISTPFEQ